jgi:2-polyprenyl-3-methyl-5-hydroxy-6-metoxy-1,4-benzoquinol methylase
MLRECFDILKPFEVLDGDWDLNILPLSESPVYIGCIELFIENKPWSENSLRSMAIELIKQGIPQWARWRVSDFDEREDEIRSLYENIKNYGIFSQRELLKGMPCYNPDGNFNDEIAVAIGRNGNIFLFNGFHRTSIAKILKLKRIPVRIVRVHTQWKEFCERSTMMCAKNWQEGLSYHPINHISFDWLANQWSSNRADIIKENIGRWHNTVLDIGSLFGYFSTQLEDDGFQCTAVENHHQFLDVLYKIKEAGYFKFNVIPKSVFDINEFEFDVVLALNVFHHYLKTQDKYEILESFLKKLKTKEMFVQLHDKNDQQMNGAYRNYDNDEFLRFICRHTGLYNIYEIGEENNRKIFKIN